MSKQTLKQLLTLMVEKKGSDLHIGAGTPPMIRVDGELQNAGEGILSPHDAQTLCHEIMSQEQIMKLEEERELDFAFQIEGVSRFRANCFWQHHSVAGAFRRIPFEIFSFEQLGLPVVVKGLTEKLNGLVLVTGATGSGKSTTLATMIDAINQKDPWHIMTVEDPIEFVFEPKKSMVHQREVARDTVSFKNALKYMLRQDPDVVLIGEMRDLETIQAAITIAETGHLVFATLHTNSAAQTVDRIIDSFPANQQRQIRVQLAGSLLGIFSPPLLPPPSPPLPTTSAAQTVDRIIDSFPANQQRQIRVQLARSLLRIFSQRLVPRVSGGLVPAHELLLNNTAVANLIREGRTPEIDVVIETGSEEGMVDLNHSLAELVSRGEISAESAYRYSFNPKGLDRLL